MPDRIMGGFGYDGLDSNKREMEGRMKAD